MGPAGRTDEAATPPGRMTFEESRLVCEFKRWSGRVERVIAERVEFAHGGVITFWTGDRLELAVKAGDWNDLREVVEP